MYCKRILFFILSSIAYFLSSYSSNSVSDFPVLYPLANLNETCLSEESLYTDDSSDSNEGETGSGSESEDPTFVLDTSQKFVIGNGSVSPELVRWFSKNNIL